jgi:hypothetical protein
VKLTTPKRVHSGLLAFVIPQRILHLAGAGDDQAGK